MAKCYHKACDVWDPSTRAPDSPRFLASVTQAVLESVLEMAEEEIIQKVMIDEKVAAEKDFINENAVNEDVIKEDVTDGDVIQEEEKEKVMEETTVQPALSKDEAMSSARESEVVAVPRKAFSRDILSQQ